MLIILSKIIALPQKLSIQFMLVGKRLQMLLIMNILLRLLCHIKNNSTM